MPTEIYPASLIKMTRAPATFRQRDIKAAIKAAAAAGCTVASVEIDPVTGKIKIMMATGETRELSDLDKWLAQHAD